MSGFRLSGRYRVQSRLEQLPSTLVGQWIDPDGDTLDRDDINAGLRRHRLAASDASVTLRAARIDVRTGAFLDDDALYYRGLFIPNEGSETLACDVLDTSKLEAHWIERASLLCDVLAPATWGSLRDRVARVRQVATDEYLCHEGGHMLGVSVDRKLTTAWFRPGGRTAWPLIYMEELRADLGGLGLAAALLSPSRAAAVFGYHLGHRLGLAALSTRTGRAGAGAVPYLLFGVLEELGVLAIDDDHDRPRLAVVAVDDGAMVEAMHRCGGVAAALSERELAAADSIEAALPAAQMWRRLIAEESRARRFLGCLRGAFNP